MTSIEDPSLDMGNNDLDTTLVYEDPDVELHGGIVDSFYQAMKVSTIDHVKELKQRLINEKNEQLAVQLDIFTTKLNSLTNALDTMTSNYHTSERKRASDGISGITKLENLSMLYELSHRMYISEYSVKQIFSTWKLVVLKRRRYTQLTKLTKLMLKKRLVSRIFHRMHKASMHAAFARREKDNNVQVGTLAKQVLYIILHDL
jgi:hypothetical protein